MALAHEIAVNKDFQLEKVPSVQEGVTPFYIVSNYIKRVTTSWTYGIYYIFILEERIKVKPSNTINYGFLESFHLISLTNAFPSRVADPDPTLKNRIRIRPSKMLKVDPTISKIRARIQRKLPDPQP